MWFLIGVVLVASSTGALTTHYLMSRNNKRVSDPDVLQNSLDTIRGIYERK